MIRGGAGRRHQEGCEVRQSWRDFYAFYHVSRRRDTGTSLARINHSRGSWGMQWGAQKAQAPCASASSGGLAEHREFWVLPGPPASGPWGPEHASWSLWEAAFTSPYSLTEVPPSAVKLRSQFSRLCAPSSTLDLGAAALELPEPLSLASRRPGAGQGKVLENRLSVVASGCWPAATGLGKSSLGESRPRREELAHRVRTQWACLVERHHPAKASGSVGRGAELEDRGRGRQGGGSGKQFPGCRALRQQL